MTILNDKQIKQKLTRLAYEIIEQNTDQKDVYLAGINTNGSSMAKLLMKEIEAIKSKKPQFHLIQISLNPAKPHIDQVSINTELSTLTNKSVIVVDDVANTGRTLFFAFAPFMSIILQKLQAAVLIDRKHKSYPISVAYVGLSLATTIKDNISVQLDEKSKYSAIIE